jgi:hypothetical protein
MATPASQRRQSNRARPPAERPSRPGDVGMKLPGAGVTVPQRHPKASSGSAECFALRVGLRFPGQVRNRRAVAHLRLKVGYGSDDA